MPSAVPTIKERAQGDRPVAVKPRRHKLLAAGSPQALLISLHIDVAVVINLGGDEHPFKVCLLVADDPVAQRRRIDITGLDPLMPRTTGVAGRPKPNGNAGARA